MWLFGRSKKKQRGRHSAEPSSAVPASSPAEPAAAATPASPTTPSLDADPSDHIIGTHVTGELPNALDMDVEVMTGEMPSTAELAGLAPITITELTREERIREALDRWRHTLSDLADGRGFLLDLRGGPVHLDLTHSHPQGLAHLFAAHGPTRLSSLVREPGSLADARRNARLLREIAQSYAEERGLTTCYLGIGEASWLPADGSEPVCAPVLLRATTLQLTGNAREDVALDLDAGVELNPVLLKALRDAGVVMDARALLDLTNSAHGFDPTPVLDALRSLGEPLNGFRVGHALVVGNLVDATGPMLEDFDVPADELAQSDLLAALAGDADARLALEDPVLDPTVVPGPDDRSPQAALDAPDEADIPIAIVDPDEAEALTALERDDCIVIETASGGSATASIVNLMSELAAKEKRVLVISQRASHLSDIADQARAAGLDELLLDLKPHPQLQRRTVESLLVSLSKANSFVPPTSTEEDPELAQARTTLRGHVEAMHRIQVPWGVSAHEAINALSDLLRARPAPRTQVRLQADIVHRIGEKPEYYRDLLERIIRSGALELSPDTTEWAGASVSTRTQADRALELVEDLHQELLPELVRCARETAAAAALKRPSSIQDVKEQIRALERVEAVSSRFSTAVFTSRIEDLIAATADKQWRERHGVRMGARERRTFRREAASYAKEPLGSQELFDALNQVRDVSVQWQKVAVAPKSRPIVPDALAQLKDLVARTQTHLDELAVLVANCPGGTDFGVRPLADVQQQIERLREDRDVLTNLPEQTTLLREAEFEGLTDLVTDLRERAVPAEQAPAELNLAWWSSVFEFIAAKEPTLSEYTGTTLSQIAERYRRMDGELAAAQRYRIRSIADQALVRTMKSFPDTSRAAIIELNNPRTTSVKDVVAKYQEIMFRARPLWLISPYMVPQLIPPGEHFDVVIVADGSRLPTAAAVPALTRARRAVVIGDAFEYAGEQPAVPEVVAEEEAELGLSNGLLLDDVRALAPIIRIRRDEHPATGGVRRFVSMLTRESRPDGGDEVAVPSPLEPDDDTLEFVPDARGAVTPHMDYVESTEAELRRVTEMVLFHARNTPERSLAVLTPTPEHARRLMDRIMATVGTMADVRSFFQPNLPEFFTVAPAVAASSVTRDEIIVSLGFGLTPHDRLLHSFGPLSGENGRKALVTMLTRARLRTVVVTGLRSSDFDANRLRSQGAQDLMNLLRFLESGCDPQLLEQPAEQTEAAGTTSAGTTSTGSTSTEPADPEPAHTEPADSGSFHARLPGVDALVTDLADRLWRRGYRVELDYGLSRERVEMALGHPGLPGRWLVAVETDGERYSSTPNQRERDRLRIERLEKAGWVVERVWSWALFIDPVGEADRVARTIERAHQRFLEALNEPNARAGGARHRLPKPKIPAGHPLSFYGAEDFDAVVAYISSDGQARLTEQLAADVREFLGFEQRSVLLDVSVSSAIRRYQETHG